MGGHVHLCHNVLHAPYNIHHISYTIPCTKPIPCEWTCVHALAYRTVPYRVCVYIYIYMYREREMYIHMYMVCTCIYIYIYIERERYTHIPIDIYIYIYICVYTPRQTRRRPSRRSTPTGRATTSCPDRT